MALTSPPITWVWGVYAVRGDRGRFFFIDYVDGTVLGTVEAIID